MANDKTTCFMVTGLVLASIGVNNNRVAGHVFDDRGGAVTNERLKKLNASMVKVFGSVADRLPLVQSCLEAAANSLSAKALLHMAKNPNRRPSAMDVRVGSKAISVVRNGRTEKVPFAFKCKQVDGEWKVSLPVLERWLDLYNEQGIMH